MLVQWFQDSGAVSVAYFHTHSRAPLVAAVKHCIDEQVRAASAQTCLHPFRILISLLDRPDVGAVILEDVLLDVLKHMYSACVHAGSSSQRGDVTSAAKSRKRQTATSLDRNSTAEIVKTANLLFGTFEPYYIWEFLARLFEDVCSSTTGNRQSSTEAPNIDVSQLCRLITFLLDTIALVNA